MGTNISAGHFNKERHSPAETGEQRTGGQGNTATDIENSSYDWQTAQKPLSERFESMTEDDFQAADGDRNTFVQRLAQRKGISENEAADDLSAFEGRQSVNWRSGTPVSSVGQSQ